VVAETNYIDPELIFKLFLSFLIYMAPWTFSCTSQWQTRTV